MPVSALIFFVFCFEPNAGNSRLLHTCLALFSTHKGKKSSGKLFWFFEKASIFAALLEEKALFEKKKPEKIFVQLQLKSYICSPA